MKDKKIKIRLDDAQYELLNSFTSNRGITNSDLIRFFINGKQHYNKSFHTKVVKEIIQELHLSIRRLNLLNIKNKEVYLSRISHMIEQVLIYLER